MSALLFQDTMRWICAASGVRPAQADGIATTAGAAWVLGNFSAAISATSSITNNFTIIGVVVSTCDTTDEYEIVLYAGPNASEVEVGRTKCHITNPVATPLPGPIPIRTPVIAGGSQIKAKIASKGGAGILSLSIIYI